MSMNPNKIKHMRQSMYIPVYNFAGLHPRMSVIGGDASITALGMATDGEGTVLAKTAATDRRGMTGVELTTATGGASSAVVLSEIGSLGYVGLLMNATSSIRHQIVLPPEWDRRHPIDVHFWWTSAAAAVGSRSLLWAFVYGALKAGTNALLSPASLLDTIIVVQAPTGTANMLERTSAGIIDGGSIAEAKNWLNFQCTLETITSFAEDKWLLGVEFTYTPRFGRGLKLKARDYQQGQ